MAALIASVPAIGWGLEANFPFFFAELAADSLLKNAGMNAGLVESRRQKVNSVQESMSRMTGLSLAALIEGKQTPRGAVSNSCSHASRCM